MRTVSIALIACMASAVWASQGSTPPPRAVVNQAEAQFASDFRSFLQALLASPTAPPGIAVVVVHGDRTIFERAYGTRDKHTNAPLTLDTPMYNGSVTKAYTGVLAAILDADGTLPLSTRLADVWPTLQLPAPLDAKTITAERLLSHSAGFNAFGLVFRSVWVGEVNAREVPAHLARFARPDPRPFQYNNLGPFVWSAMAETRTGTPWRDLLQQRLLRPLGLRRSSARLEDFPEAEVARCHPRIGGRWAPGVLKPTATMNAAGGMYASPRDQAAFLKVMITDGRSAGGVIPAHVLRRSWQRAASQDRKMWGLHRDGYGLGWDLGTIAGHRFVARSGGYPGCRSMTMFLPEKKLGIVVLSNGGLGANTYHAAIFGQAIDLWTGASGAKMRGEQRISETHSEIAEAIRRADAGDPRLAHALPVDLAKWRAAAGAYRNERLAGDVRIGVDEHNVRLSAGVLSTSLRYVDGDQFLISVDPEDEGETLEFVRDSSGSIVGFMWDDDRYDRVKG